MFLKPVGEIPVINMGALSVDKIHMIEEFKGSGIVKGFLYKLSVGCGD